MAGAKQEEEWMKSRRIVAAILVPVILLVLVFSISAVALAKSGKTDPGGPDKGVVFSKVYYPGNDTAYKAIYHEKSGKATLTRDAIYKK